MNAQLALPLAPPKGRYYVTTRLTADQLTAALTRAHGQTEQVLALYRTHASLSPSQAHRMLTSAGYHVLLTSVRRSISTLTREGSLRKSGRQVMGPHGAVESVWELSP